MEEPEEDEEEEEEEEATPSSYNKLLTIFSARPSKSMKVCMTLHLLPLT